MRNLFYLLSLSFLVFTQCNSKKENPKPADTTKPVIELESSVPDFEKSGKKFKLRATAGKTLTLNLKFSDNEALKQAKIDIHDAFDGHTHARMELIKWKYSTVLNLTGTTNSTAAVLTIPSDVVAGPYHLLINALDASGNEAKFVEIDLKISNPAEEASITGLNLGFTTITKGQTITVAGLRVIDNKPLDGGSVEIHFESEDGKISLEETIGSSVLRGNSNIVISPVVFIVPANAPVGKYAIHVKVKDGDGNISEVEYELSLN